MIFRNQNSLRLLLIILRLRLLLSFGGPECSDDKNKGKSNRFPELPPSFPELFHEILELPETVCGSAQPRALAPSLPRALVCLFAYTVYLQTSRSRDLEISKSRDLEIWRIGDLEIWCCALV